MTSKEDRPVREPGTLAREWYEYEADLLNLCAVKADEFRLLGYEQVSAEDIWRCVRERMQGAQPLHRMVEAILGLQVGQFMNYATLNAFKAGQKENSPFADTGWFDGGKRG
ncbi:post-transcriptional regulator [Alicyclobacillus herbarius]|uniref:post-transcriptional regulator n=1 Tax=Alicyclobacillus herbarius TaxID=122960 RepID=UPI00040A8FB7|nr:post-transcriptional regulator [Alicyclobacillus herbarius]